MCATLNAVRPQHVVFSRLTISRKQTLHYHLSTLRKRCQAVSRCPPMRFSRLYGLPGGIESRSTRRVTHRGNCFAFDLYWYRKSFDFRVSAKRTLYVRVNECLAVYSANRARTRVRSHPLLQLSQCGHCVATGTKRFQPLCPHWRGGFFSGHAANQGFCVCQLYANCMPIGGNAEKRLDKISNNTSVECPILECGETRRNKRKRGLSIS